MINDEATEANSSHQARAGVAEPEVTMTTYTIKHSDQHGDWWFVRQGRWSDDAADALRFTDEAEADREASSAQDRLNADRAEGEERARVRVIKSKEIYR